MLLTLFIRSRTQMKDFKLYSFIIFFCGSLFSSYAQEKAIPRSNTKHMEEVRHLSQLHTNEKALSVNVLFKGEEGIMRSLQIKKEGLLPEHTTSTPAVLVCVMGKVTYEDEMGYRTVLEPGNFQKIEPHIKHWVKGLEDSQLLLMK